MTEMFDLTDDEDERFVFVFLTDDGIQGVYSTEETALKHLHTWIEGFEKHGLQAGTQAIRFNDAQSFNPHYVQGVLYVADDDKMLTSARVERRVVES
jgi:hypothetical protein